MEHTALVSELPKKTRQEIETLLARQMVSKSVFRYFGITDAEFDAHCIKRHGAKAFFTEQYARSTMEMVAERGTSVTELAWAMIHAHVGFGVYECGLLPRDVTEKMIQEAGGMVGRRE